MIFQFGHGLVLCSTDRAAPVPGASRLERRFVLFYFYAGCERHGGAIRAPTRPCMLDRKQKGSSPSSPEQLGVGGGAKGWGAAGPETPPLSRPACCLATLSSFTPSTAAAFRVLVYCEPPLVLASLVPPLHAARHAHYGTEPKDRIRFREPVLPARHGSIAEFKLERT